MRISDWSSDVCSSDLIEHLRLAGTAIEVSERSPSRVEALAQSCLDTLEALFAEVADVVGGDHGLDVGRQAAATRPEVDAVVREVHIDAAVEQLAEVRPVSEVPGSAVDLVEDDAGGTTAGEATDHAAEYPTSRLRRCLHLFEPLADSEAVERGVPLDCLTLGSERCTLFLLGRRDAHVREVRFHGSLPKAGKAAHSYTWRAVSRHRR